MVKQAVILAAGIGSRLKEKTAYLPKGFLELGGKTLIEESVAKLLKAGIENIYIGTGFRSEYYEQAFAEIKEVSCIKNNLYRQTGSMYTLYSLKDCLSEDFLILESDLVYEQYALNVLQNSHRENVILSSIPSGAGDEVYIETDATGCLLNMSKNPEDLNELHSEFVGITRISLSIYDKLCRLMETCLTTRPNLEYDEALALIAPQEKFAVLNVPNLAWCEIDNEDHFTRARHTVLPRIKQMQKVR